MATVMMPCPVCQKPTPHYTPGTERNEGGERYQAHTCAICGCWTNVRTGEHGEEFQENVDTPDNTDFASLESDADRMPWRWNYPIYIAATPEGAIVAEVEGRSCVLLYTTKELAELYVEQAGDSNVSPEPIRTDEELRAALENIQDAGVMDTVWDPTLKPQFFKIIPIADLLDHLRGDEQ